MINPGSPWSLSQPQSSPPAGHVFSPVHAAGSSRYTAQVAAAALSVTKTEMGSGSEWRLQGTVLNRNGRKKASRQVSSWHPEVSETKYGRSSRNLLRQGHRLRVMEEKSLTT